MTDEFEVFVRDRLDRLLRFATALTGDPHLAQDIVQEVVIRVRAKWSRIARLDAPDLYVRRMVVNEALSLRRRRAWRDVRVPHQDLAALPLVSADVAERLAERDAMRVRIAGLPRKQRAALVLRYYEDRTDAEIAEVLGCAVTTARSHVSLALKALRAGADRPVKEAL